MMIIKTEANSNGQHMFQSQSHRTECWLEGYITVPKEIESEVIACNGYCEFAVENGEMINFVARYDLIPTEPKPESKTEQLIEVLYKAGKLTEEEYKELIEGGN